MGAAHPAHQGGSVCVAAPAQGSAAVPVGFPGFLWPSGLAFYTAIAALTWLYLQPGAGDLSSFSTLRADWIVPRPTTC